METGLHCNVRLGGHSRSVSLKRASLTALIMGCLSTASGSDIRTVGQTKVDLQPIHDWKAAGGSKTNEAKGRGERPLSHWKDITVLEYVKSLGNPVVVVKLEGGETQTIMLKNCPATLVANLIHRPPLDQRLKAAKIITQKVKANYLDRSEKAEASARAARGATWDSPLGIAQTQDSQVAKDAYEDLARAEKNETAITEEFETLSKAIESMNKILAMYTGQSYATFPIWDTGITSR